METTEGPTYTVCATRWQNFVIEIKNSLKTEFIQNIKKTQDNLILEIWHIVARKPKSRWIRGKQSFWLVEYEDCGLSPSLLTEYMC